MNASRVFARELQRKKTKQNSKLLAECCDALSMLVDFVHDVTGLYPAWGECDTDTTASLCHFHLQL